MSLYRLDRSDKKRDPCPSCGRVGKFRPYINTETGEALGETGFCDRIESCSYHRTPKQHFADLGQSYEPPQKKIVMPPPKRTHWRCPDAIVAQTQHSAGNTFAKWLVGILGDRAKQALRAYRVGTFPKGKKHPELEGAMIWWQIGEDDKPRSGKIIAYDETGHRRKDVQPNWVHSVVTGKSMDALGCAQVLFGSHLLKLRPDAPVAIVESEKSALIASCFYPQYVWLGAGGSHGLSLDKCIRLSGRDVTLFPDKGIYESWQQKAIDIEPLVNSIEVSDILEAMGADDGSDVADYLILSDGSNHFEKSGISLFANRESQEIPMVIPKPQEPEKDGLPPILHKMFARNGSLSYLCSALDLDTENITIKPLT